MIRRILAAALLVAGTASAQHMPGMHGHGADGTGHDMVTMPGLRGLDATPAESAEMAAMFRGFTRINRSVTELADGIRTETWTDDPELRGALVSHVTGMIDRVETGRDPQVFIQSPTLDIFFARRDTLETTIDLTNRGVIVTQTSTDPEVVAALHKHAAEVTDMADRGMQSVHERMMRQ